MSIFRLRAVIGKELLEIRKSRLLVFTVFLPPLVLVLLPLGLLTALRGSMGARRMRWTKRFTSWGEPSVSATQSSSISIPARPKATRRARPYGS